jgi:hypothetical protein
VIITTNALTLSYLGDETLDPTDWRRGTLVTLAWIGIAIQIALSILVSLVFYYSDFFVDEGGNTLILWMLFFGGWIIQIPNIMIITYLGPKISQDDPIDLADGRRWGIFTFSIMMTVVALVLFIIFIKASILPMTINEEIIEALKRAKRKDDDTRAQRAQKRTDWSFHPVY